MKEGGYIQHAYVRDGVTLAVHYNPETKELDYLVTMNLRNLSAHDRTFTDWREALDYVERLTARQTGHPDKRPPMQRQLGARHGFLHALYMLRFDIIMDLKESYNKDHPEFVPYSDVVDEAKAASPVLGQTQSEVLTDATQRFVDYANAARERFKTGDLKGADHFRDLARAYEFDYNPVQGLLNDATPPDEQLLKQVPTMEEADTYYKPFEEARKKRLALSASTGKNLANLFNIVEEE